MHKEEERQFSFPLLFSSVFFRLKSHSVHSFAFVFSNLKREENEKAKENERRTKENEERGENKRIQTMAPSEGRRFSFLRFFSGFSSLFFCFSSPFFSLGFVIE